jgi:TolB-like protein
MIRDARFSSFLIVFLILLFAGAYAQVEGISLASAEIDKTIKEANSLYWRGQFEDAVIMTSTLLANHELTKAQETDALLVLAMCEANRDQKAEAQAYLERLAELDPTTDLDADLYPPQMMKIWYAVSGNEEIPDVIQKRSIAVMYFDNMSISKDKEDLDPLSKGLASMMIQDITKAGRLRVVERDRINFLIDELKLQQSDLTDQNTAVEMGKLVGAKTILMGGFMKLDKNNFKIYGRLVSVETSEIIKAEEVSGNPKDIFKLQKELVFKILDEMKVEVNEETRKKIDQGKDAKYEALYHYSLGLALEDKDDYKAAYAEYEKAVKIAPGYAEAEKKMNRLEPMALKG